MDIENGDVALKTIINTPANPGVNVHVVLDSRLSHNSASVVSRESLALAAHDTAVSAPAVFLLPTGGMGSQVVAAPAGSENPAIAAGLLPLMLSNVQYQPERARGHAAADPDYVQLLETGPIDLEAEPVPLQRPTLEDRRRAFAKAKAPAMPPALQQARALGFDPTIISAGSTAVRVVTPIEVEGIRYMAPPTAQEMECRAQLELLKNQLTDVAARVNACSGQAQVAAQPEQSSLERSMCEVYAELFLLLDLRQTGQIADIARAKSQQQSSSSGHRLTGHTGPISYGPPIIEEVTDLGETF